MELLKNHSIKELNIWAERLRPDSFHLFFPQIISFNNQP